MFSKKEAVPVQRYVLDVYPNLKDLTAYTEKSKQVKGMKHAYEWEDKEEHKKFTLSILCNEQSGETEWWMHEESVAGNRMVFFYKTNDMGLIFTQMCQTVGAPESLLEDDIEVHREHKKNYEKNKEANRSSLGARLVKKKTSDLPAGYTEGSPQEGMGLGQHSFPEQNSVEDTTAPDVSSEAITQTTLDRMMSGDLKTRPIGTILQSAQRADATGHLVVEGSQGKVTIQFGLGKPVHAFSDNEKGVEVILELFAWKDGKSTFSEGIQPESASVQDSPDEIIKQGEYLLENMAFLEMHKINEISVLQAPKIKYSEDKLIERLQDGALLGIKLQTYFIESVDGHQTVSQIAAKANLTRSKWINVVGNLLKLGLINTPDGTSLNRIEKKEHIDPMQLPSKDSEPDINIDNSSSSSSPGAQSQTGFQTAPPGKDKKSHAPTPPSFLFNRGGQGTAASSPAVPNSWPSQGATQETQQNSQENPISPAPAPSETQMILGVPDSELFLNDAEAEAGRKRLLNPDSGLVSFDSFQFLLKNEFARAFRFGSEFTFVVFCINITGGSISNKEVLEIAKTMQGIIREVDSFGHFGEKGFGILLPGIRCEQATSLCSRVMNDLPAKHPELAKFNPTMHFGLASVPYDEKELEALVSSAQKAMLSAVEQNIAYIQAADLKG